MSTQTNNGLASIVLSVISMIFYGFVYLPQFRVIYVNKTSIGLSLPMIIIWCQADSISLFATIFINLSINVILVNWYHMFMGFCMIIFAFYFKPRKTILAYVIIPSFIIINFTTGLLVSLFAYYIETGQSNTIGQSLGWVTTCVYIIGRIPQIFLNYKRKSTSGLSILMYVFTILGNLFYIASVLTYSTEQTYILNNLPWFVFTGITFCMDSFVIYQSYYYKSLYTISENDLANINV